MSDPAKTTKWQASTVSELSEAELEEGAADLLLASQEIEAQMGYKNRTVNGERMNSIDYANWRAKALYAKAHIDHTYRKFKIRIKEIQNGRRERTESSCSPRADS